MKLISFPLKLTEHSYVKRSILLYSSQQQLKFVTTHVFGLPARSDERDVAISLYFTPFAKVMM